MKSLDDIKNPKTKNLKWTAFGLFAQYSVIKKNPNLFTLITKKVR